MIDYKLNHTIVATAPKGRYKHPFICLFIPPVFTEHFARHGGTKPLRISLDKMSQEHRSERQTHVLPPNHKECCCSKPEAVWLLRTELRPSGRRCEKGRFYGRDHI